MSPVSSVFHAVVTVILTLWVFFHIWGTRVVETQFQTANPDPYPIQQRKTDLGMLVVLSTSQFHYIQKQSNLCNISSKLRFQLWKGVLSGNETHYRHFGANSENMCFCCLNFLTFSLVCTLQMLVKIYYPIWKNFSEKFKFINSRFLTTVWCLVIRCLSANRFLAALLPLIRIFDRKQLPQCLSLELE